MQAPPTFPTRSTFGSFIRMAVKLADWVRRSVDRYANKKPGCSIGRHRPDFILHRLFHTRTRRGFFGSARLRAGTPSGKVIRTAVWDGRRNHVHELPDDIVQWVGGDRIAIVQVDSPVGVNRRSSLDLTHKLSFDFDGVIHRARDTETFQSILKSFIRLDLDSVGPPALSDDWKPEVVIFAANSESS